jgi:hypothetical protein
LTSDSGLQAWLATVSPARGYLHSLAYVQGSRSIRLQRDTLNKRYICSAALDKCQTLCEKLWVSRLRPLFQPRRCFGGAREFAHSAIAVLPERESLKVPGIACGIGGKGRPEVYDTAVILRNALRGQVEPRLLRCPIVRFVTLAELDLHYKAIVESDMKTNNYGWYQGQLIERVRKVYAMRGFDFLKEVRAAFPPGEAPQLGSDEALRRVERIDPSFTDWAKALANKPRRQDTAP